MPGQHSGRSGSSQADGSPVELEIDSDDLADFAKTLARAAEPKRLRRELAKDMRGALQPAVSQARSGINAMGHDSRARATPALRPTIARNIRAEVRLSGRVTGARVKVKKTRNVRGFLNAPKLTNRDSWRRPVFGRDGDWVEQRGKPGWFDDPMQQNRAQYKAAVVKVMAAWAARISRRG